MIKFSLKTHHGCLQVKLLFSNNYGLSCQTTATMLVDLLSSCHVDKNIQELLQKFVWRFFSLSWSISGATFIFLLITTQYVSDVYWLHINSITFTIFPFMSIRLFVPITVSSFVAISSCTHFIALNLISPILFFKFWLIGSC